ncbi:hypothetical protein [Desulfogranum marinum]|uniref:hypothetical protein n=1 Tax=Desulfogranum marinum TaxID=453220 RepID=UPI001965E999|nr:hypothetical protein [Desulfogranum marinum]MBM9513846.1 hypothetical protein [Desulfogranum marinum]
MSQWLIFLAIIPLSSIQLTKHFQVKHRWLINGIAFGLVVAPVSLGLLQMTYIPLIGKLLGLIGLIANLTHGSIGFLCLLGSGVLELNSVISAPQLVIINIVNAVLFAHCYGLIGYSIDKKLETETGASGHMMPV